MRNRTATVIALFAVSALVAFGAFAPGNASAQANILVLNNDGPNEGFNDPTPFTPVGGNNATTLGQARLNAFQYAANIWGAILNSGVTIVVQANMDPLTCTATSAVLGQAGPTTVHRDFTGAPVPGTWYCQALANSLANTDLSPANPDIVAQFNSNINGSPSCLGGYSWYYGYDGNVASNQIDFVTVVMHEIGHGLGFLTFVDNTSGAKFLGYNDTYMLNVNDASITPHDWPSMTDAQRQASAIDDPNLRWTGTAVTTAWPNIPLTAGLNGNYVRLHAPNPLQQGSSVSHWSTAVTPNEVMEPVYTGPDHDPSLALQLMEDIGWSIVVPCVPAPTTLAAIDTTSLAQSQTSWDVRVTLNNTGTAPAVGVTGTMISQDAWLTITDPSCAYGTVAAGASSDGAPDQYTLDITNWPGGSFTVKLALAWQDSCGNAEADTLNVGLQPAVLPTDVGGPVYAYHLEQNVPNPFNPTTTFRYEIARAGEVVLRVYDVRGSLVRTLVASQQAAGPHDVTWDGRDDAGRSVASGVYFYRLRAGSFTKTRRMVLLK